MILWLLRPLARILSSFCGFGRTELVVNKEHKPSASEVYLVVGAVENVSVQARAGSYDVEKIGLTVLMLTPAEFVRARDRAGKNPEDVPHDLRSFTGD